LASLESNSEHPLASAIVSAARKKKLTIHKVSDFEIIEGKGLKGKINGNDYYAGNLKLMRDLNLEINSDMVEPLISKGKTPVIFTAKNEIIAYVAIADTVKEDSKEVIEKLHK